MKKILLFVIEVAVAAGLAHAQTDASDQIKLGNVTFSGSLRLRLYDWDWFAPAAGNNNYVYSGNLLRFGFSEKRENWDWDAEFAVPFLLGLPSNPNGTGPQQGALGLGSNYVSANHNAQNTAMIFPKQLFVRWDGIGGDRRQKLQLGRFEFFDGVELTPKNATLATVKTMRVAQRLIGNFGFTDVQRSFDGVHYSFTTQKNDVTIVGATPTRGVFQVDGWGWNKVGFGYGSYTHEWGSGRHAADTEIFFIEYDDWRPVVKADNRPAATKNADLANVRIDTFGGHSVHVIETKAGSIDGVFWGAVQTGRWGAQTQRAGAFDLDAGFQPKILPAVKPWLRGGYTFASGDGNPNDKTHGTFFALLPTPRAYARFPFYNMMNLEDAFGTLTLRPHKKITVSDEYHSLRLANANDLWYSGGGAFQPWTFGFSGRSTSGKRSLGNLYDLNVEYRATRKISLTGYFGYTQGLAAMEQIYPTGKDGKFGYLELLYKF